MEDDVRREAKRCERVIARSEISEITSPSPLRSIDDAGTPPERECWRWSAVRAGAERPMRDRPLGDGSRGVRS